MNLWMAFQKWIWISLSFTRIPGNALSFWIRKSIRWSRGKPILPHEPKDGLFDFFSDIPLASKSQNPATGQGLDASQNKIRDAERRAETLCAQFQMNDLQACSTQALYRKNLYLLETLNGMGLNARLFPAEKRSIKALDIGSQDWHYVFGLERWLRFAANQPTANRIQAREITLRGVELDGYGIYRDFHSRSDYANAYAAQTGNSEAKYLVGDFLKHEGKNYDLITWFYPFVTRHHLLLWGLPLFHYRPEEMLQHAIQSLNVGGCLITFCHTTVEHEIFVKFSQKINGLQLMGQGAVQSDLVDFYESVVDRKWAAFRRTH